MIDEERLTPNVAINNHSGIAFIDIDCDLTQDNVEAVCHKLERAIEKVDADRDFQAIVIVIGRKHAAERASALTFTSSCLSDVVNRIERATKPIVTAWFGSVLGPECEIGLASHARVIDASARIGFLEAKLGLIPTNGGTQRLPRLIGIQPAIDLIVSSRMANAVEAFELGLADFIYEKDLREAAMTSAQRLVGKFMARTCDRPVIRPDETEMNAFTTNILRRYRGQEAPKEIVRLISLSSEAPLAEGLAAERETHLKLAKSSQSAALLYLIDAEGDLAKRNKAHPGNAVSIERIGIIGAGTMGAGIGVACLMGRFQIVVVETSDDALQRGRERIHSLLDRLVTSGRMPRSQYGTLISRIVLTTDLKQLASVDLVIEAVFEDMDIKKALLSKLERLVSPDCILATNTSYLDINAMATSLKNPSRLVGMHFFSPAHIMKLLEIVHAEKTSYDAVKSALVMGERLNKISVIAGVCDGFIGNRVFSRYRRECEFMLEEGAVPHEIDEALEDFGFAMGPFAASDLAGLDISWARRKQQAKTRSADERYVPLADMICEMGRFGQKTGSGWYRYENGKRMIDPEINALVLEHARRTRHPQIKFTREMIVNRVLSAMADEGHRILSDGIAANAQDIDLVMVNGYGFPAYRGGPMFAAVQRALPQTQ